MFRKVLSFGGMLLLAGAAVFMTPGFGLAQHGGGHGGGSHGGGGGFHSGGFHGSGFRGGGFHGSSFHSSGFHDGRFHDGQFHGRFGYYGYYPYPYDTYPYSWSSPVYDYGNYDSFGDVTPSYPDSYPAVTPAAADYQPFDPPAPAAPVRPDTSAHVTVHVPAGAQLWFDGKATTAEGSVREFETPPLTPGSRYLYEVRALWNENGQEVTQTQRAEVSAGSHVDVTFPVQPTKAGTAPNK